MGDRAFEDLLSFIEAEMDFEPDFYDDAYLGRRIAARIRRTGVDTYRAYRRLLESDLSERDLLLDSLSIGVTGFFRNPGAWEALRPVLRDLTDGDRPARIWSAPCADGREPYSIAMLALDDAGIDAGKVEILASDVNADALEEARRGRYEATRSSDVVDELEPLDDYGRYIDRRDTVFTVREHVRELVTFERHDLVRGEQKRGFDLVLCRNFLIYVDTDHKRPVFETITGSLAESGYLLLGTTESLPTAFGSRCDLIERRHRIYRKR